MARKRKQYDLGAERNRVEAKFPDLELRLPDVPGTVPADAVEGSIAVNEYDAKTVVLPPLERLTDEQVTASTTNQVVAARLILGDDYDHFTAAGGSANLLFQILQENSGATAGESESSDAS